jgi:uronate dehydrogenase
MPRVLITGAAGRIGRAITPYLREDFELRLLDRLAPDGSGDDAVVADLNDPAALRSALVGVDAVVHLAATHGHGLRFEASLDANYRGTLALLEATRDAGVKRFIYASSHHVMGLHRSEGFDALSAPLAPDAYYGLGKAFGELACSLFAHRYGIHTLVLRIGNADPSVADERALRIWTSAADLAQLVSLGLSAGDLGLFEIAYGGSICPDPIFPRDPVATRLGYTPRDRALDHLAPGYLERSRMPPSLGPDFVGGAYAAVPLAPLHDQEER